MSEDYSIAIDLSLLPLPVRNDYMKVIKNMNIRYLLENQILRFSYKHLKEVSNNLKG